MNDKGLFSRVSSNKLLFSPSHLQPPLVPLPFPNPLFKILLASIYLTARKPKLHVLCFGYTSTLLPVLECYKCYRYIFSSLQLSRSVVSDYATPWITARQASLSITSSRSLLKPMSIESVMPSSHLILCCPLLLLPPIPPSIRVFSNESTLRMRWPKYWSFSFSIRPSNEHTGLISPRMDWLELLAVQGILKSLLQHHSSKASILWLSAFFTVQLSHPYITTGKTIALTRWAFVGKVMSLLFNILSRLVITFLPRSKRLLISWLQSPSAVTLEPPKIKSDTVSTVSPSISHEVMGYTRSLQNLAASNNHSRLSFLQIGNLDIGQWEWPTFALNNIS